VFFAFFVFIRKKMEFMSIEDVAENDFIGIKLISFLTLFMDHFLVFIFLMILSLKILRKKQHKSAIKHCQ